VKWLAEKERGISLSQAINFVNSTVVAQLLWGSAWFINASNNNFRIVESITISAYKVAMSLPRNTSNKVCWAISAQPSIKRRITMMCDKFIFKTIQLKKPIISNRIKSIGYASNARKISKRNIPFLILRWNILEHLFNNLHIWDRHPHFEYPMRLPVNNQFRFQLGCNQ